MPGRLCHLAADFVITVDVAGHPAAAMEEKQDSVVSPVSRCEQPYRHFMIPALDGVVPCLVGCTDFFTHRGVNLPLERVTFSNINIWIGQRFERRPHGFADCDGNPLLSLVKTVDMMYNRCDLYRM